jgi:Transcription factor WhiB
MPAANPAARARVHTELARDAARSDSLIAALARCSQSLVVIVRRELEAAGDIEPQPPRLRAWLPSKLIGHPHVMRLPRQPDLSQGSCRAPGADPDQWTSRAPAKRQAAIAICQGCPVLDACAEWSLSLPISDTTSIYGAMTGTERIRRKKERAEAARLAALPASAPWGQSATNAAKTHCDKGHRLEGANVKVYKRKDGSLRRECQPCHNAACRASMRLRRQLQRGGRPSQAGGQRGISAVNAAKTECSQGHKLEGDNVIMATDSRGRTYRRCRECANRRARDAYRRARERLTAAA